MSVPVSSFGGVVTSPTGAARPALGRVGVVGVPTLPALPVLRARRAAEGPIPAALPLVEPESFGKPRRGWTVSIVVNVVSRVAVRDPAARGKVDQAEEPSREFVATPFVPRGVVDADPDEELLSEARGR